MHNIQAVTGDTLRLDQQLCFALHATSRAVTQAYAPLLAPLGVTYPQYLVLLVLWEEDGLTVSGLGTRLHLDSGTLTPLLKRLEGQGIVTRHRDTVDERVVRVALTMAGKRLRARADGIHDRVACAIGAPPSELVALRDSLQEILHRLHSLHAEAPATKIPAPRTRKQRSR